LRYAKIYLWNKRLKVGIYICNEATTVYFGLNFELRVVGRLREKKRGKRKGEFELKKRMEGWEKITRYLKKIPKT